MPNRRPVILALALVSMPAVAATPGYEERCGMRHTTWSHRVTGEGTEIELGTDRCRLTVQWVGDVRLNGAKNRVTALDAGGKLDVRETFEGVERRLLVSAPPEAPTHRFWVDGLQAPVDGEEADPWLRLVLPNLYRVAGIDVRGRVAEILEESGLEAALQEVGRLRRGAVQQHYLEALAEQADLDEDGYAALLETAGRELSDHELAALLVGFLGRTNAVDQRAYIEAAARMRSDKALLHALTALVAHPEFEPANLEPMIAAISRRSRRGGGGMAFALANTIARREGALPPSFPRLARAIPSDYQQRHVLTVALQRSPDMARIGTLLAGAEGIESDYEVAELLVQVGWAMPAEEALPESFFTAAATIGSDYEKRRALSAAVHRPGLPPPTVAALLESAHDIESDYEMAEFLTRVAETQQIGEALAEPFEQALKTVDSLHERQRVEASF